MKRILLSTIGILLLLISTTVLAGEELKPDSTLDQQVTSNTDQIIVYYLHSNRRCATCKKLEKYSYDAITTGFKDQLADSSVVWKVVNFETEGNEHYAKNYALYTQSLIVSRIRNNKEVDWLSLEKIWTLVGDEVKFSQYVQSEVQSLIDKAEEPKK